MNHYRDKKEGQVYAYDDEQLATVARMGELELLIQDIEPQYIAARNNVYAASNALEQLKTQLNNAVENEGSEDVIGVRLENGKYPTPSLFFIQKGNFGGSGVNPLTIKMSRLFVLMYVTL